MPKKNQRSESKLKGLRTYYTGIPCQYGHICNRVVKNASCVQCNRDRGKIYRLKNLEAIREKHRLYQSEYQKLNPEVKRKAQSLRRARNYLADGSFTTKEIKELLIKQDNLCAVCKCDLTLGYQIDHKTPLSRGGSNWIDNIQLLCPADNRQKNASTDYEYRVKLGLVI